VVLGETDPDLLPIFLAEPSRGLWQRGVDFDVDAAPLAVGGRAVDLHTPNGSYEQLYLPLHGRHQAENLAVAVAASEAFFGRHLDDATVEAALGNVVVPGRFEVLSHHPLVVVDAAHNPPGASATAATFDQEFGPVGRRIYVVGMFAGRDLDAMLRALDVASADLLIACTPPSERAIPASEIAAAARALGTEAEVIDDVVAAVDAALAVAGPEDAVLIAGTQYVAGPARTHLRAL
jgi:dihydrofolate synthase/folylpolyglutamate synthase